MKTQEIVRQYDATAGASFAKANAYDLQGWAQVWELWEESGLSQADFAQVLHDAKRNTRSTVKTNLSHLKWALDTIADETGEDVDELSIMNIVTRWVSLNALRAERYPSQDDSKKTEPKPKKAVPAKGKKFNAKERAREFTVAQLIAMLAEHGVK